MLAYGTPTREKQMDIRAAQIFTIWDNCTVISYDADIHKWKLKVTFKEITLKLNNWLQILKK